MNYRNLRLNDNMKWSKDLEERLENLYNLYRKLNKTIEDFSYIKAIEKELIRDEEFIGLIMNEIVKDDKLLNKLIEILRKDAEFVKMIEEAFVNDENLRKQIIEKIMTDENFINSLVTILSGNQVLIKAISDAIKGDQNFINEIAKILSTNKELNDALVKSLTENQQFLNAITEKMSSTLVNNDAFIKAIADKLSDAGVVTKEYVDTTVANSLAEAKKYTDSINIKTDLATFNITELGKVPWEEINPALQVINKYVAMNGKFVDNKNVWPLPEFIDFSTSEGVPVNKDTKQLTIYGTNKMFYGNVTVKFEFDDTLPPTIEGNGSSGSFGYAQALIQRNKDDIKDNKNAIDYTNSKMGILETLKTKDKSNAVNAINETFDLAYQANNEAVNVNNRVGNLNNLNTTAKDNLVNAINEVNSKPSGDVNKDYVDNKATETLKSANDYTDTKSADAKTYTDKQTGDLTKLATNAKDNLVNAINEINNKPSGDVTKDYVDTKDAETLASAKSYTDEKTNGVINTNNFNETLINNDQFKTTVKVASDALTNTQTNKGLIDGLTPKVNTNTTSIGTLGSLTTTAKDNLVNAVNEVNAKPNGVTKEYVDGEVEKSKNEIITNITPELDKVNRLDKKFIKNGDAPTSEVIGVTAPFDFVNSSDNNIKLIHIDNEKIRISTKNGTTIMNVSDKLELLGVDGLPQVAFEPDTGTLTYKKYEVGTKNNLFGFSSINFDESDWKVASGKFQITILKKIPTAFQFGKVRMSLDIADNKGEGSIIGRVYLHSFLSRDVGGILSTNKIVCFLDKNSSDDNNAQETITFETNFNAIQFIGEIANSRSSWGVKKIISAEFTPIIW